MDLLIYIKRNFPTPNTAVLRRLGASERLIDYLKHTSLNTNFNIVPQLIDGGGGESELIAKISQGFGMIMWNHSGEKIRQEGNIVAFIEIEKIRQIVDNHGNYEVFALFDDKKFITGWYEEPPNVFKFDLEEEDADYEYNISIGQQESGYIIAGDCSYKNHLEEEGPYVPIPIEIYIKRKA